MSSDNAHLRPLLSLHRSLSVNATVYKALYVIITCYWARIYSEETDRQTDIKTHTRPGYTVLKLEFKSYLSDY